MLIYAKITFFKKSTKKIEDFHPTQKKILAIYHIQQGFKGKFLKFPKKHDKNHFFMKTHYHHAQK